MISFHPALHFLNGFPHYLKIRVRIDERADIWKISQLEVICEEFSQQFYGISFERAIKRKLVHFQFNPHWVVGVNSLEELNYLVNAMEVFQGFAYTVKNDIHRQNLKRFEERSWQVLPKEDPTLPRFWVYIKASDEVIELIDRFVTKNDEVKSLQRHPNYVLCFDSEDLLLQAKLTFPNIDKIEHLINVNELGERLL